ncbi:MAG: hypothetical protein K8U03_10330 [Planctomycetia bacterium]|nr:hypothetical protein [Planctomycetia bacterium]
MTQESNSANLLADLETRQDELLRLLDELEQRTKQALANLLAPAKPAIASGTLQHVAQQLVAPPLGKGDVAATEPRVVVAENAASKEEPKIARSRRKKAA